MRVAVVDGQRRLPSRSAERGACPGCGAEVVAKCGALVDWYWSHLSGGELCDPWHEPETEWHLKWKNRLSGGDPEHMEVRLANPETGTWHQADVLTPDRWVIELQHSPIAPNEIEERERFYSEHAAGIAWLFDADVFNLNNPFGVKTFTRDRRVPLARVPVFVDTSHDSGRVVVGVVPVAGEKRKVVVWGLWTHDEFAAAVSGSGLTSMIGGYFPARAAYDLGLKEVAERTAAAEASRARYSDWAAARREQMATERAAARATARSELEAILAANPTLSRDGLGREQLPVTDADVTEFQYAVDNFGRAKRTKRPSTVPVANGNLIAAAIHLEVPFATNSDGSISLHVVGSTLKKVSIYAESIRTRLAIA